MQGFKYIWTLTNLKHGQDQKSFSKNTFTPINLATRAAHVGCNARRDLKSIPGPWANESCSWNYRYVAGGAVSPPRTNQCSCDLKGFKKQISEAVHSQKPKRRKGKAVAASVSSATQLLSREKEATLSRKMFVCQLGLFFILLQAEKSFGEETKQCQPGFSNDTYVFKVTRKILERGRVLGKVRFDDCTERRLRPFSVDESRFRIAPDGTVSLKRQVQLHGGVKIFTVHTWDSAGRKYSAEVAIRNEREPPSPEETQHAEQSDSQVMYFPKSQPGLHRRKRDWIIPPIKAGENERGPFPKSLVQIKCSTDNETKVFYSITGQGADTPPEGIFAIDRYTGQLYVTRVLDRETVDQYIIFAQCVSESGKPVEDPMRLIIKVSDQNDNDPVFTEAIFEGEVLEDSRPGTSVMQVTATDADDAEDTYNGVVWYRIRDQEPKIPNDQMFTINRDTGVISVIATGLKHEKVPKYTLTILATDSEGQGNTVKGIAMIKVSKTMSASPDSPLTTHVLNTASGTPAKGLRLQLSQLDNPTQRWVELTTSFTNADGRCPGILSPERFTAGTYKLRFETGEFWKQLEQISFYPYVEVVFTILDPGQKYHIPLLMTPFSYTTYRGS
ncbi:EP-cadherin-like [Lissotriton helveticus]